MQIDYKNYQWTVEELKAFLPPEKITVSEWADKYRILTQEESGEHGQWHTSRTPYLKFPQDLFNNPEIEEIVVCKGTQAGFTEFLMNCLGYSIDQDPASALYVYPTIDLAEYASRNRIQRMIDACERLKEKKSKKIDEFKMLEMTFNGMVLSLSGANSAGSLASRPCRYLFLDEVDKYPAFAGKEADPISLAYQRTTGPHKWNRKILIISTPTLEAGNIWTRLHQCQIIYEYYISCPHCGYYQTLIFEQVKWPENIREPEEVKQKCWYECDKCSGIITENQKNKLIGQGEWRPSEGYCIEKNVIYSKIGLHINSLYSPWLTFGDMAAEFLKSKDTPTLFQNFWNSWKGLPWVERILKKEESEILRHKINIPQTICPDDTMALTAGVDPGQGGFWFLILAWRQDKSVHLVHYGFVRYWEAIKKIIIDNRYTNESSTLYYPVWRSGVDTGGSIYEGENITMTESAYNFIRPLSMTNRVFGTKGASTKNALRMTLRIVDKMPGKFGKKIEGGLSVWHLNADQFKNAFHYRLQVNAEEEIGGGITFHSETGNDIAKHINAEERRRDRNGQWSWEQIKRENHLFDCFVIALAMGDSACWGGVSVLQKPEAFPVQIQERKEKRQQNMPKKNNWFGEYGKNLLKNNR